MRAGQPDGTAPVTVGHDGLGGRVLDTWAASIIVLDRTGRVALANGAWDRTGGYLGDQVAAIGSDFLGLCDSAAMADPAVAQIADGLRAVLLGTVPGFHRTYSGSGPDRGRWFEITARPVPVDGSMGVLVVHEDITGRRHVKEGGTRALLVDEVDAAVMGTDLDGVISSWSRGAERLFGWSGQRAIGRRIDDLLGLPAGGTRAPSTTPDADIWEGTFTALRRDGSTVAGHLRNVVVRDADGLPSGMVAIAVDLTEHRATGGQLRAITESIRDGVCTLDQAGLVTYVNPPGRRMMRASLTEPLGGSFRHWIHGMGDSRPWETPGRGTSSPPVACQLVRRDGSELHIELVTTALHANPTGPAMGWVVVFRDVSEAHDAEDALAKGAEEVLWLGRIRDALGGDGFLLHAQPVVDLETGRTVQHELLLRMVDPDDPSKVISPSLFLPTAEKLGVAPSIDRWVLTHGLQLAAQGHPVEINISARSLEDVTLPHRIEQLLAATGADPAAVVFEITETALLDNDLTARYFADQVRALGCGLALDDFGTGYGGFTYLKHFPLDYLKIDIEFVRDAVSNAASRHVIASIVSLAAAFELQTVAEGVEDEPTLALLRHMGVDLAQGYHLGRPGPTTDVFAQGPEGNDP